MVTAIIFAGGTGSRVKDSDVPKQFLEINGKPIIIKVLEYFSDHIFVDRIVVVCLENWISVLKNHISKYGIQKVICILPGGDTGFKSIRIGLDRAREMMSDEDVVLICDGVRPCLTSELITNCIKEAQEFGSAVPVSPSMDSVLFSEDGITCERNFERKNIYITQAPQGYKLKIIMDAHLLAEKNGTEAISSADLLIEQGKPVHLIEGIRENIKVTTREDINTIRATEYYEHFKAFSREELKYE